MIAHTRRFIGGLPAIRPWPLTIGGLALVLVLKLAGVAGVVGAGMIAPARANGAEHAPAKPAGGHGAAAVAEPPGKPPAAAAQPPVNQAPAAPVPTVAELAAAEAEKTLLQDLRARRVALDDRSRTLDAREAVLAAAERRIDDRVGQLTALQATLEALDRTRRDRDEANWRGLVKTYEAMRPRDAAAIFNDLEKPVLMQVLDRMKEAKTAAVLAAMQPDRARIATTELAQWRVRSVPSGDAGSPVPPGAAPKPVGG